MPRPRAIEEAPLPNWPILMGTAMAARYLSLDENSFALVTYRAGVHPVDLGLAMVRWRRNELDRLVNNLPANSGLSGVDRPAADPDRTEAIVSRVVDELSRRTLPREPAVPHTGSVSEAMGLNDAAKAIGVGRTTIYKLIAEGRLATKRFGRRVLVRRADLEALLQQPDPEAAERGTLRRRVRPHSLGV